MAQHIEGSADKAVDVDWVERQESVKEWIKERVADRDERSPQQQLDVLDERLGKDVGADKERKRLKQLIRLDAARRRRTRSMTAA